jgi:glycerol-3-phosphate acyltransferase PlsX
MSAVRVALDAMGGDRAPGEICAGAVAAAVPGDLEIILVGREEAILPHLPGDGPPPGIHLAAADEIIDFGEEPAAAVRSKPGASLVRTAAAVRDGGADAAVSAGSTGAMMAASLFAMRRIPGVARPGLAAVLPGVRGPITLIDCGATIDPRPEQLVQFAHMGLCFAQDVLGISEPTCGLLSIGEERGKGNQLTREAYELLAVEPGLHFRGNIEGRDLIGDKVDVIVTDCFTGNVALKTAEGTARQIFRDVRDEAYLTVRGRLGGFLLRPTVRSLRVRADPETYGGAYLLGLAGVSVIAHGSSSRVAIANACRMAAAGVRHDICAHVASRVAGSRARGAG